MLAYMLAALLTAQPSSPPADEKAVATPVEESTKDRMVGRVREDTPSDVNSQQMPNVPIERLTWKSGAKRTFISTQVDAGYIYLKPRLSIGYGTPFFRWFGVDVNPLITQNYIGGWGGLRLALPVIDVRAGARYVYSLRRDYLPNQSTFDRTEIELSNGGHATTLTYELEVTTGFATRIGEFGALGSASRIGNVPAGQLVFEEVLRVVAEPTYVWRARAQFAFYAVPGYRQFTVGPAVDFLIVPKRDEVLIRAGVVARIVLNRSLEIRGSFVPTVHSRDSIGLLNSDFTELGVRYRWASD